jgi:pimeloyl-ACP methyl ester carboxylesterase
MLSHSPARALRAGNPHEKAMAKLMEGMHEGAATLGQIKTPTLVIHGDQERAALPRFAISMSNEIPGARLEFIKGMGHMFLSRDLEDKITSLLIYHIQNAN